MAVVTGTESLIRKLHTLIRNNEARVDVIVGYTANYAIFVHEDLTARHAPGKTAKYLEHPYREMINNREMSRIVTRVIQKTGSLRQGLLTAGLRLQRESQKIVPIDTGFLRASAFTREDK